MINMAVAVAALASDSELACSSVFSARVGLLFLILLIHLLSWARALRLRWTGLAVSSLSSTGGDRTLRLLSFP